MNLDALKKYPFFTARMLAAFEGVKHAYTTISRNKHKFITIEKGKYTVHTNPMVYATTLTTPSYCSLRSALQYYQLSNQIPLKIQVITGKRKRSLKDVAFIASPHVFGFRRTQVDGFTFFVAEKEKLLLDCLFHHSEGIQPDDLKALLREPLDLRKITAYLRRINNAALTKRTGYLLESEGKNIYPQFSRLLKSDANYPKLVSQLPATNNKDVKWRLQIND